MYIVKKKIVELLYMLQTGCDHSYVTANLRNQIFPGIPNPFRESGESLKCIEIPRNL